MRHFYAHLPVNQTKGGKRVKPIVLCCKPTPALVTKVTE